MPENFYMPHVLYLILMLLKNCKIISREGMTAADILIEGEKIKKIGKDIKRNGLKGEDVINVKNLPVIPGLIDAHVHMRDFKESFKEDFFTGTKAAIAGGFTTIIDMPNTNPPVTDKKTFDDRIATAERKAVVDFCLNFGIKDGNLEMISKVNPASFKIYMDGSLGRVGDDTLEHAVRSGRVAVHPEDAGIIERNLKYLNDREDFLFHGNIREPKAEEVAVKKASMLAKKYKKSVHLCHISYRKSLNYLNEYTTSEVTPHHLLLTESDLKEKEGFAKTNPPIRSPLDLRALWTALKAGRIDIIASDHAPHTVSEKEEDMPECPSGIPNLDVTLKLMLTLVNRRTLSLTDIVRLMAKNPARIFKIKGKGEIREGMDADIVILDMKEKGKIEADEFYSKAKYSPFEGWKTTGGVRQVILRGTLAFDDGEIIINKGSGRYMEIEGVEGDT